MKTMLFEHARAIVLRKKGRKVRSHGTFRAKRHPNSKLVRR